MRIVESKPITTEQKQVIKLPFYHRVLTVAPGRIYYDAYIERVKKETYKLKDVRLITVQPGEELETIYIAKFIGAYTKDQKDYFVYQCL